jgi:PAS domain S-box-containing protein
MNAEPPRPDDGIAPSVQAPRRSLARRVLASFAVVVLAFVGTAVAGIVAQQQAAQDVASLSRGYLPLEIALARSRESQWTLVARLDWLLDDPRAAGATTKNWLQTIVRLRPNALAEARRAASGELGASTESATRQFAGEVILELDEIGRGFADASRAMPDLFAAIESGEPVRAAGAIRDQSAKERALAKRLDVLADRIGRRRDAVVVGTVARDRRAMAVSIGLALLSLAVAAIATRQVQVRLAPLGRLTGRARAIAAGDRSRVPEAELAGERRGEDEIGALSEAFGAMVENVVTRDAELRKLQRRLEDILDHLRASVVALSADGRIAFANPAADQLLGARAEHAFADAAPPLWRELRDDVERTAREGIEPPPHLGLAFAREGEAEPRVLDARVVPMRADEGERLALLVVDDVSEAAAARARALAAERLAAMGKMAAHVTHEIRNPLSSIGLNVELLEETIAAASADVSRLDEARGLLSAIAREVERLAEVSEEYLRVARMPKQREAAEWAVRAEPRDLGALLSDVLEFGRPELERARVNAKLVLPREPVVVSLDEQQLRKALGNLLRNAREAMEDGGTITVALALDGDTAVLELSDEGTGIPEALRSRIFDPFFTTKATGTGLGLPLTRQIIEAHGATITCSAVAPRGTRFSMRFPLAAPPARG